MAAKQIKGFHDGSITVKTRNTVYNVDKNAVIVSSAVDTSGGDPVAAIMEDMTHNPIPKNNTYNIDGHVIGYQIGILTVGAGDEINIGATGRVNGAYGVYMIGENSHLTNAGEIVSAAGYGAYAVGKNMHLRNDGDIYALGGMIAAGDKVEIVNGAKGEISAIQIAVGIGSSVGDTGKFINHGTVQVSYSEGLAFQGQSGKDIVVNDGLLKGHVILGDGNDSVDDRGGKIQGSIVGGQGDDVLITDHASDKLYEEASGGTDTVRSTASYTLSDNVEKLVLLGKSNINGTGTATGGDILTGNAGNNTLRGLAGADELTGGKGNDVLTGGLDADIFHFAKGDGKDTITDFTPTIDKIDVSHWTGIDDFADVISHAKNQGEDVLIKLDTDSVLIKHLHKADLADADFIFPI